MASVEKFKAHAVVNILRHNERTICNPSNKDIDPDKSSENYSLLSECGVTAYDRFCMRKKECYCYGRDDVVMLVGWVITAPGDLPDDEQEEFFHCTYDFLNARYGKKNCIQAIVHKDESGRPHLHYIFVPAVPDKKHGGEKICTSEVITRKELRNFHPSLQKYLQEHGVHGTVMNGVTKAQGGNRTVREMKEERRFEIRHEYDIRKGRW